MNLIKTNFSRSTVVALKKLVLFSNFKIVYENIKFL